MYLIENADFTCFITHYVKKAKNVNNNIENNKHIKAVDSIHSVVNTVFTAFDITRIYSAII